MRLCFAGPTGHTSGECIVKAASNAGKHPESLCWVGTREQHDSRVQVKPWERAIIWNNLAECLEFRALMPFPLFLLLGICLLMVSQV